LPGTSRVPQCSTARVGFWRARSLSTMHATSWTASAASDGPRPTSTPTPTRARGPHHSVVLPSHAARRRTSVSATNCHAPSHRSARCDAQPGCTTWLGITSRPLRRPPPRRKLPWRVSNREPVSLKQSSAPVGERRAAPSPSSPRRWNPRCHGISVMRRWDLPGLGAT